MEISNSSDIETTEIQVKVLPHGSEDSVPRYMSEGASGMDLRARIDEPIELKPLERKLIPTGLAMSIPTGFEVQIRPRSGMALKHGITMLNSPGTIDSDYRGEVGLIAVNLSNEPFTIEPGMRLAQMVVAKYVRAAISIVDELDETARGAGGFGHTGKH